MISAARRIEAQGKRAQQFIASQPIIQPPHQFLAFVIAQPLLEVEVQLVVPALDLQRVVGLVIGVVDLELHIRLRRRNAFPEPQEIASRKDRLDRGGNRERRFGRSQVESPLLRGAEQIALQAHSLVVAPLPIQPEAAPHPLPGIFARTSGRVDKGIAVEVLGEEAVIQTVGQAPPMTHRGKTSLLVAETSVDQRILGVRRVAGDDVDDAVDRVGAPQRGARPADHLDLLHIVQHQILDLPEHPREHRIVHAAAVDQHQLFIGEDSIETADGDRPSAGVETRHLHPGHQAQRLGNRGHPRAPQVVAGDHRHRRRRLAPLLHFPGDRRHLHLHQFLQAQIRQVESRFLGPGGRTAKGQCK